MFEQNNNLEREIKEVRFAQWLLTHRSLLKRLLTAVLLAVDIVIWTVVIYQFTIFLLQRQSYQETLSGLTKNWIDYQAYNQKIKPLEVIVLNQSVIPLGQTESGGYRYDFVAEIENPNSLWIIESFDYQFVWSGDSTDKASSFIFPNDKKYISASVQTENKISSSELEISNLSYLRKRPGMDVKFEILNNFVFRNAKFIPAFVLDAKMVPPRVQFQSLNQSAYSFWQVNAVIALYQGQKVVGIIRVPIKQWLSGQVRDFEINLPSSLNDVSRVKIIPEVNILDPDGFI